MPIDTSSYYPEVPSPDGEKDSFSLNRRESSLFGLHKPEQEPLPEPEPAPVSTSRNDGKDSEESPIENVVTMVSNVLSWVLVPLLMPVYGLMLAFGLSVLDVVPLGMRISFTLIVTAITVVLPTLLVLLLKKIGIVDDIGLNHRKERLIPYIIIIVAYGASAYFMASKNAPLWLSMFFAGGSVAAMINMLINFRWKISAHGAGIAGVVALLIRIAKDGYPHPETFTWILVAVILTGLLGSARVWLGRHNVWQVLAGYAVGFCSVFFLTMIH